MNQQLNGKKLSETVKTLVNKETLDFSNFFTMNVPECLKDLGADVAFIQM